MKKISILLVMLLLIFGAILIVPQDKIAEADAIPPIIYSIDYQYIKEITEYLSHIIDISYGENELVKGRYFGSQGELDAAEYIAEEMTDLGLYDPTSSQSNPYLDQIKNIQKEKTFRPIVHRKILQGHKFQTIYEILDRELIINKPGNNITSVDCYITPYNNYTWYMIKQLPRWFNSSNVEIIKAEDYDCDDSFLKNISIFVPGLKNRVNITADNLSLLNIWPAATAFQLISRGIVEDAFELEYNFSFSNLTSKNNSTWPSFLREKEEVPDKFVFIEENQGFNPDIKLLPSIENSTDYNSIHFWTAFLRRHYRALREEVWYKAFNNCCNQKLVGVIKYDYNNDSFDTGKLENKWLPTIYINKTIGEDICNNINNYTIDFKIKQKLKKNIESYNVIGQINGSNPDKTVIYGCLYDSMWCQGTVDSAIGVGIMLATAKYFKQNNIKPKFNLKFIAYAGEEVGIRGAYHYEMTHPNENITAVIDLNQFGYIQNFPGSIFNIGTNQRFLKRKLNHMSDITGYMDRTNDNVSNLRIFHSRIGALSDDHAFAISSIYRPLKRKDLKTVLFLKDLGWIEHHRDGMNHTKGDAIELYSSDEVNLTAEMILNITRYFTTNPNTWLTDISTELWDSPDDNNNVPDHLNVSYTIRTSMPEDRVVVKAVLKNNLWPKNVTWENYTISSNSDITHFINFSLPAIAPFGYYNLYVYLFNSTGEVDNYNYCLFKNIHHPKRDKEFANDTYNEIDVYLGGCNDMTNPASQPSSTSQNINAGSSYTFSTSSTDPNSNQVYYQFDWDANTQGYDYSPWYGPYNSGASCEIPHIWTTVGEKQVSVRSRDKWFTPNGWSNWSNPLNISVNPGCTIYVVRNTVLVNQQIDIIGINYYFADVNWNWSYGNGNTSTDQENTQQIYDMADSYTINLTLYNGTSNVSYETIIEAVNISSYYSANKYNARSNENISFSDLSEGLNQISNWTWDFGDGNISYIQNPTHTYATDGLYNVTLNVSDGSNISSYNKIICVDTVSPFPIAAFYSTEISPGHTMPSMVYVPPVGYGSDITVNADFFDYSSGISFAKFNVTFPDGNGGNYTMTQNSSSPYDYEYIFDDTWQIGDYIYKTWTGDKADNINHSSNYLFTVEHLFGYTHQGGLNQTINDRITGSVFKMNANGTADSISAYIQTNLSTPPKTKCILYRANDSKLIGSTEEKTPNTGDDPKWIIFNFTGTKPNLVNDTEYILSCWSNDTCYLFYDNTTYEKGRYRDLTYTSSSPDPANWTGNKSSMYSIYCDYTATPNILEVSHSPNTTIGLGSDIIPRMLLDGFGNDFESVYMNITYPDDTSWNFSLEDVGNNIFENIFYDNWIVGQYNYSIWVVDEFGSVCNCTGYSYNVSANATISICTIEDEYGPDEDINLTDPPGSSHKVGYELLDNVDVLHIWNRYDSYYFNKSSGIQLTNHYDEYWSQNVLMLGYYNNDKWNLIYRADELSGFNKDIETDNDTYISVTIWKNLNYKGYDFRLAIRYYLGADDNELTVIPYIKNIDNENIPYNLGFGWEMKDIQINMTTARDYIKVNHTMYYLNQTLDNVYTDLSDSEFYIMENITGSSTKSLYLKWDSSLNYKLKVKSRDSQYNAPVTLFIKIGTLSENQEKYTKMYWYDSSEIVYYFNSYDNIVKWDSNPEYIVDNITSNFASTQTALDLELCDGNTCPGTDLGTITKVELRCHGKRSGNGMQTPEIILRSLGFNHIFSPSSSADWSSWFDITDDPFSPDTWTWNDVVNLNCEVEAKVQPSYTLYCSKIEIRVTYSTNNPSSISNPYPSDSSTGVTISPVLNITVSDPEGDNMTITWLSNSSGSWQVFGTNSSYSNGTYHQIMSNASENGKWWYWKVNVSDGTNYNESNVYKFFTGCQSKIENKGSTNITGFLSIQIHYYNETSQNWTLIYEPVNDTGGLTISPGEKIGLDNYFNGRINTSCLADIGNGTYRVYAVFRDIIYVPLIMDDETELVATHEFTVTFY